MIMIIFENHKCLECIKHHTIVKVLMGIHLLIFLVWIKSHDHSQYPLMLARACLNPDGPFEAMPFYGEEEMPIYCYIMKQN